MIVGLPRNGAVSRAMPFARLAVAALIAAGLGGCGSMSEVSQNMSRSIGTLPVVGLPANAPERPAETRAFPAVHDMPPQRTTAVLTAEEQRALERELVSARETHKTAGKPKETKPPKSTAKPQAAARAPQPAPEAASMPRTVPASSSQMIY